LWAQAWVRCCQLLEQELPRPAREALLEGVRSQNELICIEAITDLELWSIAVA
jgi:hypothetical protein